MNKKKIFSDYIFNMVRMVVNIGLPIIVLPFVLNRIGPENYGIYSYANSILSYFCMFAILGIPEYASRTIARENGNDGVDKTITEIIVIQFFSVSLTLLVFYCVFMPLLTSEFRAAYFLLSILIISNFFNVEWYYIGTQKFKYISIRGIIFKALNVTAILISIKTGDDYFKYTLITALTSLGNGVVNFIGIIKYLNFRKLKIYRHIKPIIVFFSLSVAGFINGSLDKTLTGYLVGPIYVGYYALGFRLSRLILQLFTSLGNVIYPRVVSSVAQKDSIQTKKLIGFNMDYIMMLSCPIVIGMILYSQDIISLLFKEEMLPAVPILKILTFIIPIQAIRRLTRQHILFPHDKDRVILIFTIFTILANVILNFYLVPKYFHIGAALATLIVELLDMLCVLIYIKRVFDQNIFSIRQLKYIIASPVILIPYYLWARGQILSVARLFSIVGVSAIIYFITLFILRDNLFYKLTNKYVRKYFRS